MILMESIGFSLNRHEFNGICMIYIVPEHFCYVIISIFMESVRYSLAWNLKDLYGINKIVMKSIGFSCDQFYFHCICMIVIVFFKTIMKPI